MWLAAIAPTTIILDAAPPGFAATVPIELADWPIILNDRTLSSGRHIVLGDIDGPHRLWIRDIVAGQPLAYVVARDDALPLRLAALQRFDRRLAGAPPAKTPPGIQPTPFQRRRLSMLLAILDALLDSAGTPPTTHDIARRYVYPGMTIGRGSEWKSSAERRRTQRLIDEALALMRGGYRTLLRG